MAMIRGPIPGAHFDTFRCDDCGLEYRIYHGRNQAGRIVCTIPARGTLARMLSRADVLCVRGARWETPEGQEFFVGLLPDGVTKVWKPRAGRQILGGLYGSFATPLQALTGATSGTFGGKINIPAGLLYAGSVLRARAHLRKTGTGGTGTITMNVGTSGTNADAAIISAAVTAASPRDISLDALCKVMSSTSFSCEGAVLTNVDATGAGADQTTNINTAAAMALSCSISGVNAGDSYKLDRVELFIEGP